MHCFFIKKESKKINLPTTLKEIGNFAFENCKKLATEYGLDNVIFYGRRPLEEMPEFYAMADAMLVTLAKNDVISRTLPGKVQSYMAAGKPIIAAIDGECQTIINEAECGLVCNAEDYKMLSKILYENKQFMKMGENAYSYYKQNFSKSSFFKILIEKLEN